MNLVFRFCLLLLLVCSLPVHAEMRVIQLQHRTDSELIRLLEPMLNPGERIAGNGQQLIVRAEGSRMDELQQLIDSLDTPLRRLLITLDDSGSGISREHGIDARGRIRGRAGEVVIGPQGADGNRVDIRHYSTTDTSSGLRSVQTLEGSAAFIRTGQQVPQRQWSRDHRGRPVLQTVHRQLDQGFYVTPRLLGDQVILELDTQNNRFSRRDERIIEQQSLSTRVSGRLNEWIAIGSIGQDAQHGSSGIGTYSKSYSSNNNDLRIKVQLLD